MNVDELARTAAVELRTSASAPLPPFRLAAAQRRRRRQLAAKYVMTLVIVAGVAVLSSAAIDTTSTVETTPAAPNRSRSSGSRVERHDRADLGFSIEVPTSWVDTSARWGFAFSRGDDTHFAIGAPVQAGDLNEAASWWTRRLTAQGYEVQRAGGELDGREAIVVDYTLAAAGGVRARTYVVQTTDRGYLIVGAGSINAPRGDNAVDAILNSIDIQ